MSYVEIQGQDNLWSIDKMNRFQTLIFATGVLPALFCTAVNAEDLSDVKIYRVNTNYGTKKGNRIMIKKYSQLLVAIVSVLLLAGCGGSPTVKITYTTGNGFKPESRYGEIGISISSVSFKNGTVTFTYTNSHSRKNGASFDGEVSSIKLKTYNSKQILVDEKTVQVFPGEIKSLPCEGKIVSIPTDTKGQDISRIEIEHVCRFSTDRWKRNVLDSI